MDNTNPNNIQPYHSLFTFKQHFVKSWNSNYIFYNLASINDIILIINAAVLRKIQAPMIPRNERDHRDDSACGRVQDGGLEEGKG